MQLKALLNWTHPYGLAKNYCFTRATSCNISICIMHKHTIAMALTAGLFLTGGLANAYDPAAGDFSKRPGNVLRVLTYNTHNNFIYNTTDDANYQRLITSVHPDVICMQEIDVSLTAAQISARLESYFPGETWEVYLGKADGGNDGVSNRNIIASRYNLFKTSNDTIPSSSIRGVCAAVVDLPNAIWPVNFYVMSVHFKAGGLDTDHESRQKHADAIINWMRDARTAGGNIDLQENTPMLVVGDTNLTNKGDMLPWHASKTMITGNIYDTNRYGASSPPDWDGTPMSDASPYDYNTGYPWTHSSSTPAGRIDRFYYTDSACHSVGGFVLNPRTMTTAARTAAGVQQNDASGSSDHLPVVCDFMLGPDPNPPGQLVINEYNANNVGTDDSTFVEIKNIGGQDICLDGPVDYWLKESDPLPTAPPTTENEQYAYDLTGVVPAGGLFVLYSSSGHSSGIAPAIQSRLPKLQRQDESSFVLDNDNNSAIALVQQSMDHLNTTTEDVVEAYGWATDNASATRYFKLDTGIPRTAPLYPGQWTTFLLNGAASNQTVSRNPGNTALNTYDGWTIGSQPTVAQENQLARVQDWTLY